jgi:15-cis-phytoene desaturase
MGGQAMGDKVAILGAGVAGLTAAHELSERGFEVAVYEYRRRVGGKARSFLQEDGRVVAPGFPSDNGCPAEHGFRFFPGFYRHLHDTMGRIPYPGNPHGVLDNLRPTWNIQVLQTTRKPVDMPTSLWRLDTAFLRSIRLGARHKFTASFGLSRQQIGDLTDHLRTLLRACPERRFADYEGRDWLDFSGARRIGGHYETMVRAMTRSLVAARADELSVRTGGYILLQLQLAALHLRGHIPSVLNGPTSDVWLEPWHDYLKPKVSFYLEHTVQEIHCAGGRIQEVIVSDDTKAISSPVQADWYVAALPFEIMEKFVTPEMEKADPSLGRLGGLVKRWMNGVMLYLRNDEALINGHTIYVNSPWALTSISQQQFWKRPNLGSVNGAKVAGILSVDVSNWENPGILNNKPAKSCTKEEIVAEVLAQIREHVRHTSTPNALDESNILGSFVDEDIRQPNPRGVAVNLEPLLINTANSWENRPRACTAIENLFLASDYVRTYTDLATMEGANEAARRAVNGILRRSGSAATPCQTWPLHYPGGLFALERSLDRRRLRRDNPECFAAAAELVSQLTGC